MLYIVLDFSVKYYNEWSSGAFVQHYSQNIAKSWWYERLNTTSMQFFMCMVKKYSFIRHVHIENGISEWVGTYFTTHILCTVPINVLRLNFVLQKGYIWYWFKPLLTFKVYSIPVKMYTVYQFIRTA